MFTLPKQLVGYGVRSARSLGIDSRNGGYSAEEAYDLRGCLTDPGGHHCLRGDRSLRKEGV